MDDGESQEAMKCSQIDHLVDQIFQSDLLLDQLIQKLTATKDNQPTAFLASRFCSRVLSSKHLLPKLCAVIAKEDKEDNSSERDEGEEEEVSESNLDGIAQEDSSGLATQFLDKLFQHYPLAELFFTKLLDDELFSESVLEPVFSSKDMFENVTDFLQEHDELLDLM